ncbi:MAG: cache domain-containing protein [Anaerolineae bacterium]
MSTTARLFNRLRVRTAALLFLLLLPFLVLSLLVIDQQRVATFQRAQEDAAALTRAIATENANRIDSARMLLTALATLPSVKSRVNEACSPFFANLLQQYTLFTGIYAVDTSTNLGFCASRQPNPHTDNTPFEWYQRLLATQSFVVSNYRIGATSGRPGVTLAMPVFDDNNQLIAAVGLGLSLDWFSSLIGNVILPPDTLVVVMDAQGKVLAHNQPLGSLNVGEPYPDDGLRTAILSGNTQTLEAPNAAGVPYLYNFAALGEANGNPYVLVGFSEPILFAPANEAQARTILTFFVLSVLVMGVTWVSSGVMILPLRHLTEAIYSLIGGREGAPPGPKLRGSLQLQTHIDELRALINAFDALIAHINTKNKRQLEDLESVNDQLRREISERSKAQQQTRFLQLLSAELAQAVTTEQVAESVLEYGAAYLKATSGTIYLWSEVENALIRTAVYPGSYREKYPVVVTPLTPEMPIRRALIEQSPVWLMSPREVQTWFPKGGGLDSASSDGHDPSHACIILPITLQRRTIGVINYVFTQPIERTEDLDQLLQALLYQCAQVFERVRLAEEAQDAAKLQERHRLARDLHDAVSQTLFAASSMAEALPDQWQRDPVTGIRLLHQIRMLNRAVMAEMRTLLLELRPEAIARTDLKALLHQLIDIAKGRREIEAALEVKGTETRVPVPVHEAFYRIAQECINNILKHSEAPQFWITLTYEGEGITLWVRDNGRGFDVKSESVGFGLTNIHERVEAIQGHVEVVSIPGDGTQITVTWQPVPEPAPSATSPDG